MGIAGRLAHAFIDSKLTPLLLIAALVIGIFGTLQTPREEEPQIVVPIVDIFIPYPGSNAREVEERIAAEELRGSQVNEREEALVHA